MFLARRFYRPLLESFGTLSLNRPQARFFGLSKTLPYSYTSQRLSDSQWQAVEDSLDEVSKLHQQAAGSVHQSCEKTWQLRSQNAQESLAKARINPYSGRTVSVTDGNVSLALKRLDSILNRNRVRKQLRLTERHEKKGVKRRRLESERWRRLFAHEVRKNVQLVTKIRNRGA
ncbi:hypothetical protein VKT23_004163 [Stygiomarasmius scandens]|uniref:Uncharacterized protein n=1 Tax=Marasmiellus scandens TaxID=2682957 RepID=A0ABR1JXY8_9AGAR